MFSENGLHDHHITPGNHDTSDYFSLIRSLVRDRSQHSSSSPEYQQIQRRIDGAYALLADEISTRKTRPASEVSFGTSGWRGLLGKDLFVESVGQVTAAILDMYVSLETEPELAEPLGVTSLDEAKKRGCVVGFDNRFGGVLLAQRVVDVLTTNGFVVHYAGESTTGVLSAAVLELGAAFSINLTPSHNPLQYGGFKYNAADGGPAAPVLTNRITMVARRMIADGFEPRCAPDPSLVRPFDSLATWISLVRKNRALHGLDYDGILSAFAQSDDLVLAVDCVHGASRIHLPVLLGGEGLGKTSILRGHNDPTFGGIAPEPSPVNMAPVINALNRSPRPLKLGAIIDPDGDRIRFTDGAVDIDMNRFGPLAYYYLHQIKHRSGMVAKTVATSNFANALAVAFGEEVFEPRVGFKEFKPVIGRALVCFEESDGITVLGHTPEKDAYIGLLLALDMVLSLGRNLGEILADIEGKYGAYYAAKDGVTVTRSGKDLAEALRSLEKYQAGVEVVVGDEKKRITKIIAIDGRKMLFEDGSWLMIRPSGTEPKVRFYVEARSREGQAALFSSARQMLVEAGLL